MSLGPYVKALAAFCLFLLAVGAAASMATVSYSENARDHTTNDEPVVIDYNNASQVDPDGDPFVYKDDETVSLNGSTLSEGQDYEWNTSSGEITWFDTPDTTEGATANITYTWHGQTEVAYDMRGIQGSLFDMLPWLAFVVAAFAVLGLFAGFAYVFTVNTPGVTR